MLAKTQTTQAASKSDAAKTSHKKVFSLSLKGIPAVDAQHRANLERAARSPNRKNRDYPSVAI